MHRSKPQSDLVFQQSICYFISERFQHKNRFSHENKPYEIHSRTSVPNYVKEELFSPCPTLKIRFTLTLLIDHFFSSPLEGSVPNSEIRERQKDWDISDSRVILLWD